MGGQGFDHSLKRLIRNVVEQRARDVVARGQLRHQYPLTSENRLEHLK